MSALDSLLSLGIPKQKALFALKEFENNEEAAADWCFEEGKDWTPSSLLGTTSPPHAPEEPAYLHSEFGLPGPVPPHKSLVRGTKVLLVKKEDQGSGKLTEGRVRDVLTRGDHPRGVKVRTEDGTVGRVQRLA